MEKSQIILRGNCLNAAIDIQMLCHFAADGIGAFVDNVLMSSREILR